MLRAAATTTLVLAAGLIVGGCSEPLCGNRSSKALPSPEGDKVAWLYVRDCGATTGFSTNIALIDAGEEPQDGGNIFIGDDDHGKAPTDATTQLLQNMAIRWTNSTNLIVNYPVGTRVFKSEKQLQGITVQYVDAAAK